MPWLKLLRLLLVYLVQVFMRSSEDVSRAQNLWSKLSSYSQQYIESAYVWSVVVKSEVMIYDGMVCMVCFEEVLQCPRTLFRRRFDVVDFDRGKLN